MNSLLSLKIWYSVTIHIDSIPVRPNDLCKSDVVFIFKPCLHWQRLRHNAGDSDTHYLPLPPWAARLR
jgi:hypothetical protein